MSCCAEASRDFPHTKRPQQAALYKTLIGFAHTGWHSSIFSDQPLEEAVERGVIG